MWLCAWWLNIISHQLVKFGSYGPCRNREKRFFLFHVTMALCDYCCRWALLISHHPAKFSIQSSKVFICDLTWLHFWKDMWICSLLLLSISHYPVTFGSRRSHGNRDLRFFIFHVNWCVQVISFICDSRVNIFLSETFYQKFLSNLPIRCGSHRPLGNGNITCFVWHVIKGSSDSAEGGLSP